MFWDRVACVYDIFASIINRKVHKELKAVIAELISPSDDVLECACGTGMLSMVIAPQCKRLIATDFSSKMLEKTRKKCIGYSNVEVCEANILSLKYPDGCFDKVIAANVIHLLDEPEKALSELARVCKTDGTLIIPTYMNKDAKGKTSTFAKTVGKVGADFKRQFTESSYKDFFTENGFKNVTIIPIYGKIPCAVAVIHLNNYSCL